MLSLNALATAAALVVVSGALALAWRRGTPADHPVLERLCGAVWPDAWRLRRAVLPQLERIAPAGKFVIPARDSEWVGVVDTPPAALRERLRDADGVYPNNAAGLKQVGGRWGAGSYAYREDGLFGTWQVHIRLVPHGDGRTVVLAHREVSPLAGVGEGPGAVVRQAVRHYRGATLDDQAGVERARELLNDLS